MCQRATFLPILSLTVQPMHQSHSTDVYFFGTAFPIPSYSLPFFPFLVFAILWSGPLFLGLPRG
uniref:Uncharacterized protein n=1 Tax=Solanum lycopersicum TaxID=4081 RepID=A0A3Q7HKF4_SOLLC